MKVEIEVISKATIKPSSPTPNHLRNYQLSFLDQISPPVYMPLILFFESNSDNKETNTDKSNLLKTSLSKTLTHFYPLAGRLIDNVSIDCNDEGVPYFETLAKCQLSEVVQNPNPREYNNFLSKELDDFDNVLLSVQVNFFDCGGIAIGVCTSHKLVDALSVVMLITSWAKIAHGDCKILSPKFESAKFFPPKDISGFQPSIGVTKDRIVTKIFVFDNSTIDTLRDRFTYKGNENCFIRPTRVEALSCFICNRYAALTRVGQGNKRVYIVVHAVNLRTRMNPPLPEGSFGNFYRIAMVVVSVENGDLVRKMREQINSIDGDYVKKLGEDDEHLNFIIEKGEKFKKGEMVTLNFTSLCKLPLYEVDFGWGKPVRVGSAKLTFNNLVSFMDTKLGDGVEAWINMEEQDMAKFEADEELISYTNN